MLYAFVLCTRMLTLFENKIFDCLISNICNNLSVIIYKLMLHVVLICNMYVLF